MRVTNTSKNLVTQLIHLFVRLFHFFFFSHMTLWQRLYRTSLALLLAIVLFFVAFEMNFLWLFGPMPRVGIFSDPQLSVASEMYANDGVPLGRYYTENRTLVPYDSLAETFTKTLVAIEDERFYTHHGIDIQGLAGVAVDAAKGDARGGSTLTQQLVKQLFKTRAAESQGLLSKLPGMRMGIIKLKEWLTAVKIESRYSKKEIITLYCNTVDFGSNSFGIHAAARTYFNIRPSQLSWEQSAVLVGMLKATTSYSPVLNPKRSQERRNLVLSRLGETGIISSQMSDSLKKLPITLNYSVDDPDAGMANHYRRAVLESLKPWLEEHNLDVYTDGLKIYTTLDRGMQIYAERAVTKNMKRLQRLFEEHWRGKNPWIDEQGKEIPGVVENAVRQSGFFKDLGSQFGNDSSAIWKAAKTPRKTTIFTYERGAVDTVMSFYDETAYYKRFLHTGFVAMDPRDGQVKAYVGDIDYRFFKYDNVTQSKRQPGSTFKPFVYVTAMESGMGPCDEFQDRAVTINYMEKGEKKQWSPKNADWHNTGSMHTLKNAMARSLNTITVQVMEKVGLRNVLMYAEKLGIESPMDTFPSVVLGSSDVTLLELTNSYAPFVNGGYRVNPVLVTKIVDNQGKVLFEATPKKREKVLSDEGLFYMTHMFRGTLSEPLGTTQGLFQYDIFKRGIEFGGKTGTSQNNSDGWFIGISPKIIAGSWVGGSERSIHFRTTAMGEGCKTALPTYGLFMERLMNDKRYDTLRDSFNLPKIKATRNYLCHTPWPKLDSLDSLALLDSLMFTDLGDSMGEFPIAEGDTLVGILDDSLLEW